MRLTHLILLLLVASPFAAAPVPLEKPGNIQASFTRDSVNHILGFAVPIACYYLFGGGIPDAIPIGTKISGWWGSVNIIDLKFKPIDPFTQASLNWVKDEKNPTMRLQIQNITMEAHVGVRVWLFHLIPLWGANIRTKDLNITIDVSTSNVYNVYPQLHLKPKIEAFDLHYDFSFIGGIIRKFLPPMSILPMIEKGLVSAIDGLNDAWRNPSKVSGLVGLMGKLFLSLHPTRPFDISPETDLIEFGLDGRVYD